MSKEVIDRLLKKAGLREETTPEINSSYLDGYKESAKAFSTAAFISGYSLDKEASGLNSALGVVEDVASPGVFGKIWDILKGTKLEKSKEIMRDSVDKGLGQAKLHANAKDVVGDALKTYGARTAAVGIPTAAVGIPLIAGNSKKKKVMAQNAAELQQLA